MAHGCSSSALPRASDTLWHKPAVPGAHFSVGPTEGTEILRGADRDLRADLYQAWAQEGQIPAEMSAVDDVANAMLSLIAVSRYRGRIPPW